MPFSFLLLVGGLLLSSCSTAPAYRILTSVNAYEFTTARYAEACRPNTLPSPPCVKRVLARREWAKALNESRAALNRGGDFPRQLAALEAAEKAAEAADE